MVHLISRKLKNKINLSLNLLSEVIIPRSALFKEWKFIKSISEIRSHVRKHPEISIRHEFIFFFIFTLTVTSNKCFFYTKEVWSLIRNNILFYLVWLILSVPGLQEQILPMVFDFLVGMIFFYIYRTNTRFEW